MHCNAIRNIPPLISESSNSEEKAALNKPLSATAFASLEVLDLSYNALSRDSIANLVVLPRLRELDLTCNDLMQIPSNISEFECLEVLSLERNRLEQDETMVCLSACQRLRELNVSYNYLRGMPPVVVETNGFPGE